MMKYLLKLFLPSEEKLATILAVKIAEGINNSGKSECISKYGKIADEITAVQAKVTSIISDGKISSKEIDDISELLLPLVKRLYSEVV